MMKNTWKIAYQEALKSIRNMTMFLLDVLLLKDDENLLRKAYNQKRALKIKTYGHAENVSNRKKLVKKLEDGV